MKGTVEEATQVCILITLYAYYPLIQLSLASHDFSHHWTPPKGLGLGSQEQLHMRKGM